MRKPTFAIKGVARDPGRDPRLPTGVRDLEPAPMEGGTAAFITEGVHEAVTMELLKARLARLEAAQRGRR